MVTRPVFPGLGELPVEQPPEGFSPPNRQYICHMAGSPITIDGVLDKDPWRAAPRLDAFMDILGPDGKPPEFGTRVKMLWDRDFLYVAADLDEHDVWGTLTERNSHIFRDNDFEVFIDPDCDGRRYVELEINALNTIFDVFVDKPFSEGGLPDVGFSFDGIRHAVQIDGTLNCPHDADRGWTVEIAFPWESIAGLTDGNCPPRDGDVWRMNFGRVHWDRRSAGGHHLEDCAMSVWSPPGAFNMHIPGNWGKVTFSESTVGD